MSSQSYSYSKNTSRAEGSLFTKEAITSHLKDIDYPGSIDSILRCGKPTGYEYIWGCGCETKIIDAKYSCNLRTCPNCAKKRKRRLKNQYLPHLKRFNNNPRARESLKLITISPLNYNGPKEGLEDLKKSLSKFFRRKYCKDRIKGGVYVRETRNVNRYGEVKGWNIHIHIIAYCSYLDNRIRGYCKKCKQNLIKKDRDKGHFYCGNSKCGSLEVEVKNKDSRLVREFMAVSGRACHIDIKQISTHDHLLSYMLKYVSANKDDFASIEDMALYIKESYKKRLITTFGVFYKFKIQKIPPTCYKCNCKVEIIRDYEVIQVLREAQNRPPPMYDSQSIFSFDKEVKGGG
jgi:hypothetical protein